MFSITGLTGQLHCASTESLLIWRQLGGRSTVPLRIPSGTWRWSRIFSGGISLLIMAIDLMALQLVDSHSGQRGLTDKQLTLLHDQSVRDDLRA